jgi:hypothetical protein
MGVVVELLFKEGGLLSKAGDTAHDEEPAEKHNFSSSLQLSRTSMSDRQSQAHSTHQSSLNDGSRRSSGLIAITFRKGFQSLPEE